MWYMRVCKAVTIAFVNQIEAFLVAVFPEIADRLIALSGRGQPAQTPGQNNLTEPLGNLYFDHTGLLKTGLHANTVVDNRTPSRSARVLISDK